MRKYLHSSAHLLFFCILLFPFQSFCTEVTGFQIVGELPEDYGLLKKLQTIPNEEKKLLSPEYYSILTQLNERIYALINGKYIDKAILHEELTPDEGLLMFGPLLGIDNYITNSCVRTVFSESFLPEFYFVRFSDKTQVDPENYFNKAELEEIYQTAKKILELTSYGDHLISLGQSPAYIVEALEELASENEDRENFRFIYKIPYSGAPDYFCLNTHYKTLQLSNVITPHSLLYYRQILRDKGVCPSRLGACESIYIVDLVGTGGSFASFLKILASWYRSVDIPLPNFKMLDISVENRNFKNENHVVLPLANDCEIHVDRHFIHTTTHLSDKLDYTEGEDRIIPPFSALQWKVEYEHVYNQYPSQYAKKVIKCVRNYVRNRCKHDE